MSENTTKTKNLKKSRFKKDLLAALVVTLVVISLIMTAGCEPGLAGDEREEVSVILDWTPNTNHTGLYVALEKGYYAEEGLNVEVSQLSSGGVEQVVASGKSQFGVTYQEAVTFARLQDVPVVSIAAIIQNNTSGFASLKEKGIETPADFAGLSYGGWGSPVEEATIRYLMEKYGATFDQVEILTTGVVDFFAATEKDADFSWIYYGWDGIAAEMKGIELNYIELREEDAVFDYYTPVLVAGEKLLEENPELVERFMRATARGYMAAVDDPRSAAEILLEYAPELDRDLVVASQNWLQDKFQGSAEVWGWQEAEVWSSYAQWLYDNELTEDRLDTARAFTNEFIYRPGN